MKFRRKGDKNRYHFVDARCIGRTCWSPGMFQHRGATLSGSRNTGSPDSPCCMHNAYRGCPIGPEGEKEELCCICKGEGCKWCNECGFSIIVGLPEFQPKLAQGRRAEGWKSV